MLFKYTMVLIKQILLKFYICIQRIRRKYIWKNETEQILSSRSFDQINIPCLPKGKYLILIPHSDDEWIGNSSLISNKFYDVVLCNTDMQGGDSLRIHNLRLQEMQNMASRFQRKLLTLKSNKIGNLADVLKEEKPEYVLVPSIFDWHPEHFGVMDLLSNVEGLCDTSSFLVVMYQVTVPMPSSLITHAHSFTKEEWKRKWEIFRETYKTQTNFPWFRVSCLERINGQSQNYANEVFRCSTFARWKEEYLEIAPNAEKRIKIKESLSSISAINKVITEMYKNNEHK